MLHAVEAAIWDALRQARLPSQGALALLCAVPDTHLSLAEVVRMAAETGLAGLPSTSPAIRKRSRMIAGR